MSTSTVRRRGLPVPTGDAGYDVFLSYSHAADGRLAPALQSGLRRFARPWYRRRALAVFRDRTGLSADPSLWGAIETALSSSTWLVLLASPESAASAWVRREVSWWLANRDASTILVVVTGGSIGWDRQGPSGDALPAPLVETLRDEPLWVDLRWARTANDVSLDNPAFRDAVADVAAAVRGVPKDELVGEEVTQHRRTVRVVRTVVTALLLLLAAAVVAAVLALQQRDVAREQTTVAQSRALGARAAALVETRTDVASLLAVEAYRLRQAPDTAAALAQVATAQPHLAWVRSAGAPVTALAVSSDGRLAATGTQDGGLAAWDLAKAEQRPLGSVEEAVTSLALSGDGTVLVAATETTLTTWDLVRDDRVATWEPVGTVLDVAVGDGGDHVVVLGGEDTLTLTSYVLDGTVLAETSVDGVCGWLSAEALVRVVSCLGQSWTFDHDLQTVGELDTWRTPAGGFVSGASADGAYFAQSKDGHVEVVPADVDEPGPEYRDDVAPPSADVIAVAPDGRRVVVASGAAMTVVDAVPTFDGVSATDDLVPVLAPLAGTGVVDHLVLLAAGDRLVSTSADRVAFWDLRGPVAAAQVLGEVPDEATVAIPPRGAVSGDGRLLAWSDEQGSVVHDLTDGRSWRLPDSGSVPWWASPHFLADGRLVLLAEDGSGAAWRPGRPEGQPMATWPAADVRDDYYGPRVATMTPDGTAVLVFDGDRVIQTAPAGAALTATVVEGSPDEVRGAAFDVEGRRLALARCATVDVVDVASGDVRSAGGFDGCAVSVGFLADGGVAVAEQTGLLRVVDPDGRVGAPVEGGSHALWPSPYDRTAVVVSQAGTATVWDLDAVDPLTTLPVPAAPRALAYAPGFSTGVVFAPDGSAVFTLTPGGSAVRWDLGPDAHRQEACHRAGRELSDAEWNRYVGGERTQAPACDRTPQ